MKFKEYLIEAYDPAAFEAEYRKMSADEQKEQDKRDAAVFDRFYGANKRFIVSVGKQKVEVVWRIHSKARFYRRYALTKLPHLRRVMEFLAKYAEGALRKDTPDLVMMTSKSENYSCIFAIERHTNPLRIRLVTILPKGRNYAVDGTPKILVECLQSIPEVIVD